MKLLFVRTDKKIKEKQLNTLYGSCKCFYLRSCEIDAYDLDNKLTCWTEIEMFNGVDDRDIFDVPFDTLKTLVKKKYFTTEALI